MGQIKNLSLKKTILLYLILSLLISFFLSAVIINAAEEVQKKVWFQYIDEETFYKRIKIEQSSPGFILEISRPNSQTLSKRDYYITEFCDFLIT